MTCPSRPKGGSGTSFNASLSPAAFPTVRKWNESFASTVRCSPRRSSSLITVLPSASSVTQELSETSMTRGIGGGAAAAGAAPPPPPRLGSGSDSGDLVPDRPLVFHRPPRQACQRDDDDQKDVDIA